MQADAPKKKQVLDSATLVVQIHLPPGDPHRHTFLGASSILVRVIRLGRVRIDSSFLSRDLEANGSLNEYYHPDTGAALSHKGFLDWNLLVLEMI
jgi:hypothetical protein